MATEEMIDDDDLNFDYGRNPSVVRRGAYFLIALVTVLLPVYLYVGVLDMQLDEAQITVLIGSMMGSLLLSLAYHNIYFSKRVHVVADSSVPTKSSFKKNVAAYNAAVDAYESKCTVTALCWSLFYNNLLYLSIVVVFGIYVLASKVPKEANFVLSTVGASGFAFYNSRKAMQAIGEL
ncbi:hypothetical protein NDN08_000849 [Rhodosorus marinus]|uniref:Signal sequence receptor subunit gamma n=1 Tax=Rhodosorus marinus TaxID=101924 RepID=A0AAV8UTE2_9RHOD|nr:hypothetical protein NDN08_000849 [Rhodosorus marinus]